MRTTKGGNARRKLDEGVEIEMSPSALHEIQPNYGYYIVDFISSHSVTLPVGLLNICILMGIARQAGS